VALAPAAQPPHLNSRLCKPPLPTVYGKFGHPPPNKKETGFCPVPLFLPGGFCLHLLAAHPCFFCDIFFFIFFFFVVSDPNHEHISLLRLNCFFTPVHESHGWFCLFTQSLILVPFSWSHFFPLAPQFANVPPVTFHVSVES